MIEWLQRVDPARPFLHAGDRHWTYGEAATEVEARTVNKPRHLVAALTPDGVFELLAGIAGAGVTVVGPQAETDRPGDADLVVFTSGTSGRPKGVRLTMGNLTAAATASMEHLGHGPEDNWLLAMPLNHVGGISILVRQAFAGGSVMLLPRFDPVGFATAMRGGVTMVSVVPTMLRRLIDKGPFTGLRAVLVGGGPIPPGLLEKAAGVGMPVLPTYGMTETFGQVATLRPDAPLDRHAHPLPGVELRIGETGTILVRGPQVSPGYLGQPDRTDPWFVTNDLGEIDSEGAVRVLGRADRVIVTGGENVNPEGVEAVIGEHPAVRDSVVVALADVEWGQILACAYVGTIEPSELAEWARDRLAGFMVPKRWLAVEAIPRMSIGKPDRSAVKALF